MAFADKIAPVVRATWDTWTNASIIAAGFLAVAGCAFWLRGHHRLNKIKSEMEHD
jgi:hypothetical protein